MIPLNPKLAYFDTPTQQQWDKVRVDTDGDTPGRLWGLVAPADTCLQDGRAGCWTIGDLYRDDPNLAYAHQGDTQLDSGAFIKTAALSGSGGHADPFASPADAMAHYMGNSESRLARGKYFWQFRQDGSLHGLAFSGILWPDKADALTAAVVNAHPSSMDARWLVQRYNLSKRSGGAYNLSGACLVVQPGFPLSRPAAAVGDEDFAFFEAQFDPSTLEGAVMATTQTAQPAVDVVPVAPCSCQKEPVTAVGDMAMPEAPAAPAGMDQVVAMLGQLMDMVATIVGATDPQLAAFDALAAEIVQ